jgi:hypothetical protein
MTVGGKPSTSSRLAKLGHASGFAGVKGLDAVSHGGAVVPEVEHDALILDGGRVLRLRPLTGDVGAQGVDALDVHHLSDKSQDTVKLGAGVIATMSALVLGLLVSSAKNSYDVASANVAQIGAKFIELDELLAEYGPETMPLREQVKTILAGRIDLLWHPQANTLSVLLTNERSKTIATLQNSLGALVPVSEVAENGSRRIVADQWGATERPSAVDRTATGRTASHIAWAIGVPAHFVVCQLWAVRAAQCHGYHSADGLRALSLFRHLSDPRDEPTSGGHDQSIERTPARGAKTDRTLNTRRSIS